VSEFDSSVPHIARVYDYWLGGKDNFAADRELGERTLQAYPNLVFSVRANRAFLARTVRFLTADMGIRQFVDIGTGIPTANNTHQVAQRVAPDCRIVYVDNDPIVLSHARALLASSPEGACAYIDADLRDPEKILAEAAHTLDFTKPVAVTLISILHAIPDDDDPHAIVATVMDALPSGSYLAVSHMGSDLISQQRQQEMKDIGSRMSQQQFSYRTREQGARFFAGMDLVEPGLVRVEEWRPDPGTGDTGESSLWCAVGRKR